MEIEVLLTKNAGRLIRNHRNLLGLSIEELANRAGIHNTHLSRVERAISAITLPKLFRVSAALKIKPSLLMKELEEDIYPLFEEDVKSRT
ncbi:helix-turn-helix domain-containing protein [Bacillus sp. AK031]